MKAINVESKEEFIELIKINRKNNLHLWKNIYNLLII